MLLGIILLGVWCSLRKAHALNSYQLHDADSSVLLGASVACLDSYNANVSCPSTIGWLYGNQFQDMAPYDLNNLCTDSCFSSLQSHRSSIGLACGSSVQYFDQAAGTYWAATALDDWILSAYNVTCLKRSDGQYCNTWFQSVENSTESADCDECVIGTAQRQVNSPFEQDDGIRSLYASLTSSCSLTGFPTITPSSVLVSTATTATRTCGGSTYQVQPTDDFYSLPRSQHVATEQLLNSNGLSYKNSEFPESGPLCIENQCTIHVVMAEETCDSIASSANITYSQLKSWNMNINGLCSNLDGMVNNTICVSNPLGDYSVVENQAGSPTTAITAAPAPSNVGPGTTAQCGRYYLVATGDDCSTISLKFSILLQDFYFLNPEINGDCTNLLADVSYCIQPVGDISTYPGYSNSATHALPAFTPGPSTPLTWEEPQTASNDTDNIIIPLANATREDCWDYMWINDTRPESVDCWGIADYAGVDRDQFALWNPSLDQNPPDANSTSYDYACSVATSVSYCIAVASPTPAPATDNTPPTPRAAGEIEGCIAWMPLTDAVPCDILVANIGLPFNIFYQMNPSIGSQCTSLSLGTNYCISTDTIGVIALDQYEGDPPPPSSTGTITSAPTSTQTTGNGITTPTPTQSGMTPRCNKFYKIAPGDGCYDIANNNNIALNDFYAWNPAVGTDCGTLYLDYYVCIGVVIPTSTTAPPTTTTSATVVSPPGPTQPGIAPTCNKYVMQQAGVYCYDMAVAAQISLDQLYTWNPALNGDCSGLWTGYAYCVGTS